MPQRKSDQRGPRIRQADRATLVEAGTQLGALLSAGPLDHEKTLIQARRVKELATEILSRGRPDIYAWAALRGAERRIAALRPGSRLQRPYGFRDGWPHCAPIESGDELGIEAAILFLEEDPWFHSSGYLKEHLIRHIRRHPLTPQQISRLRNVVLAAIQGRDRREFSYYCQLARRVDDERFRQSVETLVQHNDTTVRRHAEWVRDALTGVPRPSHRA